MTTTSHVLLALVFCYTTNIVIRYQCNGLIGLLHGPSDEKIANEQEHHVQNKLLSLAQQRDDVHWPDVDTAESIFALYRDLAYQDHRALVLRDAGVISAVFTLLNLCLISPLPQAIECAFYFWQCYFTSPLD